MRFRAFAFVLLSALLYQPSTAHADTYQVYTLSSDSSFLVGLNSSGVAVTRHDLPCGGGVGIGGCYSIYQNGVLTGQSSTAPSLLYDNGTACTPSFGAIYVDGGRCNGSHEVAEGAYYTPTADTAGLFTGPDPVSDYIEGTHGATRSLFIDDMGDILYTNGHFDNNYELYDLTSRTAVQPEPSTLVLLGTGLLGAAGAAKRKFQRL